MPLRGEGEGGGGARRLGAGRGLLGGVQGEGDYTEESDVDLDLVVKGAERLNALQRAEIFADALEPDVELFIYAAEEWE